ncbi:hypothetical protein COU61_01500 [Candidatus Pacearchaeota archaeon CG10_big_fil_rev_8_21_14_0_10_35_13]|nr:MAG: hypothetical protein COU61_01500 [Candidatus Pacearchaeota archaeon CG10_big_fil_rev_8_21_14_0_10_35_13]
MRKRGKYIIDKRMKFKRGYQRKMILKIKNDNNLTWKNLADEFDVSIQTVMNDWGREFATIPYSLGIRMIDKYLSKEKNLILSYWISEILPKKWGQFLAGELNKKKIKIPQESEGLAELIAVILGDGHLERKTLTMTGNFFEREHHKYIETLVNELFGLSAYNIKLKGSNALQTKFHSTELIDFLIKNGLVLGNKITNKARIPEWIFSKREFMLAALRGLFDTDGGIYNKQKGYKRALIEFQTHSPFIRDNTIKLLQRTGFTPSKSASNNSSIGCTLACNTRIQNQKEIHKFFNVVGSANPKNILRYKYFLKRGEIPLKDKIYKEICRIKIIRPFKRL